MVKFSDNQSLGCSANSSLAIMEATRQDVGGGRVTVVKNRLLTPAAVALQLQRWDGGRQVGEVTCAAPHHCKLAGIHQPYH